MSAINHRIKALILCLCLGGLAVWLMTSCLGWEEVGQDVAKGQGTAETEIHKQETAIAQGVSTAVESYEQERDRQGAPACTSAALPLIFLGLVVGVSQSRCRRPQL